MKETLGAKGFVTIATGSIRYFELAENLLYSYRKYTASPYPFCIIADKENEITRKFDDVIIIKDSTKGYLDKLKLFRELPYDESIFIDADSLAYGDLNIWWDLFDDADDFSVFGKCLSLSSKNGWFLYDGIGEYKDCVTYIPDFNGGVYYLRNTEKCAKVFELANRLAESFSDYSFNQFSTPADEPVLALSMAVENCRPIDCREVVFNPPTYRLETDTDKPFAGFKGMKAELYQVRLIHWSTFRTGLSYYKREVKRMRTHMPRGLFDIVTDELNYFALRVSDISKLIKRAYQKRKKIPGKIKRYLKKLFK